MTQKLNKFDILDPSLGLRDTGIILGSDTLFDRWSDLDPTLAAQRINALHAGTIGNYELLDPQRAVDAINALSGDDSGGGSAYVAKAVHTEGDVLLWIESLTATDNSTCSFFGFFKTTSNPFPAHSPTVWTSDPVNAGVNLGGIASDGGPGWSIEIGENSGAFHDNQAFAGDLPSNDDQWHSVLATVNTLTDATDQCLVYVDRVKTATPSILNGNNFASAGFNGVAMAILQDTFGNNYSGDLALLWIAPGVLIAESDGTISEATLNNFTTAENKPVDPVNFPAGAILCDGDKDTFGVNQGPGGAIVQTGTFTDATTSPSD